MTHRSLLKRRTTSTDAWNRPAKAATPDNKGIIPCRVYFRSQYDQRLIIKDDKTARVDEMRVMFPSNVDVRTEDELGDIMDRRDRLLYRGPFVIRNPVRRQRHFEATLEGHAA